MKKSSEHCRRSGFTLVELLVVIAIIALLVSLLLPALARARKHSKALVCRTRLRDIFNMMYLYSADNNEDLPLSYYPRWYSYLASYYDRASSGHNPANSPYSYIMWRCPIHDEWSSEGSGFLSGVGGFTGAVGIYGYNIFFSRFPQSDVRHSWSRIYQAKLVAGLPLVTDLNGNTPLGGSKPGIHCAPGYPHPIAYKSGWDDGDTSSGLWQNYGAAANHFGKISYVFCDGHTELTFWPFDKTKYAPESSDYYAKYWHPRRNLSINPGD